MHAFILAGGFATRLWPLTERRAKPLLPIAGKPLLTWLVEGIPVALPITVSTNAAFGDDIAAWQCSIARPLSVVIEDAGHEEQKLGALGAVARWIREEAIDDDIVLLAGDNFADFSLQSLIEKFHGNPLVAGYDIADREQARRFGTIVLDGDRVISFEEKPVTPRSTIVSTGWSILPRASLPVLLTYAERKPDDIGGIFEEFLRQGLTVECDVFRGQWKDIGSFEAYLALHREIVGERQLQSPSATVDASTVLRGSIDIGPATTIRESTLTDCLLFGESTIEDCVLERCIIDTGCTLRGVDLTEKMIRAGTTLRRT